MTGKPTASVSAILMAIALALSFSSNALASGGGDGGDNAVPAPHVNWTDFGYKDKDVAGGALESGEAQMAPPLVAQMFNFAIFIGILLIVAGPRIKKAMNKNHNAVKTALAEAATMKAEASAKLAEYKKRIADVDKEVDELVTSIKSDAEAERKRIVADAEAQATALKRDAEERISASIGRARAGLEADVVAAAVAAAEGVLREKVEDADRNKLVEQFIASIENDGPSGGPGSGSSGGPGGGAPPATGAPGARTGRESAVDEGWS